MEIYNSHAHIYPLKIAEKATTAIGNFYDIPMKISVGSSENLLEKELKAGVKKLIVHSCATKPEQVSSINQFILSEMKKHDEFIGFMTLHQDLTKDEIIKEIFFCMDNGFKGIKLHPDFQKFNIDDEKIDNIYEAILETGCNFPILFHTGDNRFTFSKPYRLSSVAKKYPEINFIAAHFGGYRCWDEVDCYFGLKNVYFDTSSSLAFISKDKAVSLIKKFGVEKFFFGDDFPMWDIEEELDRFLSLPLFEKDKELILSKNIKRLLKI